MRAQPYQPKHMLRWRNHVNYVGDDFSAYYVVGWVHDHSGPRESANLLAAERDIRNDLAPRHQDAVVTATFTDTNYGHRQYLLVRADCAPAARAGDWAAERLLDEDVLDATLLSDTRRAAASTAWLRMSTDDRAMVCESAGLSDTAGIPADLLGPLPESDAVVGAIMDIMYPGDCEVSES